MSGPGIRGGEESEVEKDFKISEGNEFEVDKLRIEEEEEEEEAEEGEM